MAESYNMISEQERLAGLTDKTRGDIMYIQQMLGELRNVAYSCNAEMLVFLMEMAFAEAGDVLSGKSRLKIRKV